MIDGSRENFQAIGKEENIFAETKLSADSGFHSGDNMEMLSKQQIDVYVADTQFRKRDPRFVPMQIATKKEAGKSGHDGPVYPALYHRGLHLSCRPELLPLPGRQAVIPERRQRHYQGAAFGAIQGAEISLSALCAPKPMPAPSGKNRDQAGCLFSRPHGKGQGFMHREDETQDRFHGWPCHVCHAARRC